MECLEVLFNIYSIPNATIPNFFFDGYTGQNPDDYKRKKILMGLLKIVIYLEKQTFNGDHIRMTIEEESYPLIANEESSDCQ